MHVHEISSALKGAFKDLYMPRPVAAQPRWPFDPTRIVMERHPIDDCWEVTVDGRTAAATPRLEAAIAAFRLLSSA